MEDIKNHGITHVKHKFLITVVNLDVLIGYYVLGVYEKQEVFGIITSPKLWYKSAFGTLIFVCKHFQKF